MDFSLWDFLESNHIHLEREQPMDFRRCEGDKEIMIAINQFSIKNMRIKHFNRCRVYLQVLTLADIITGDGKCILHNVYYGTKEAERKNPFRLAESMTTG